MHTISTYFTFLKERHVWRPVADSAAWPPAAGIKLLGLVITLITNVGTWYRTGLVFAVGPWELEMEMRAIQELLGVILFLRRRAHVPGREMMVEA